MDSNNRWKGELSFTEKPYVTLRYNGNGNSLVRIIDETPVVPEEEEMPKMSALQHVLYFLLYTPKKPEKKFVEPVFREEVLAEEVSGFEIVQKGKDYCVLYK